MSWQALKDHLIQSAAAAALLGGGSLVVTNTIDVGKQESRIARLEKIDDRLEDLQKNVADTRETVIRLETRMENPREQSH